MKTFIKIIYISILSLFAFVANAQSKADNGNSGAPWISKDVQKVSNRDILASHHLTVKSIDYTAVIVSKGVHKPKNNVKHAAEVGNITSKGYPEWIISKPASRVKG